MKPAASRGKGRSTRLTFIKRNSLYSLVVAFHPRRNKRGDFKENVYLTDWTTWLSLRDWMV
jgi:hypothetical protein